jgi:spore germination cell wall hydrolase CwlJ-like protein
MRFLTRCRVIPAAILVGLVVAGGSVRADTAPKAPGSSGAAGAMTQERFLLRSASGARIAELTGVARPKAREGAVTAASRDIKGVTSAAATVTRELDMAALDAMPPASGDADWQCLAQAIYFESRGEPLAGQVAVAEVVLNRRDSRQFPHTVCGVTKQGCQFSYTCDGRSDTMTSSVSRSRSEKLASLMLAGHERSLTEGALYFHTRGVRPDWSRRFTRTTTIGHHMFYRPATQVAGG